MHLTSGTKLQYLVREPMAALSRSEPTPNHGFVRQLPATLTLAPSLTLTLTLTLALAPTLTLALTLALTLTRKLWMRALGWEVVICCDGLPAVRQRLVITPPVMGCPRCRQHYLVITTPVTVTRGARAAEA